MSVPVNMRRVPVLSAANAATKHSAYFPAGSSKQQSGSNKQRTGLVPLTFPATNTALWDKTPTGLGTTLHISHERNLGVHILEKTLRLAYRHASAQLSGGADKTTCRCFLIGQAVTNGDDDGLTVTVDRFDPGRDALGGGGGILPTARLPGDHVIPLTVNINKEFDSITHTEEEFKKTFQLLQHHCSSREAVNVSNLVSLRVYCCCYANDDDITFSLHVAGVTIETALDLTPIGAVPIIPTALARNLQGPLNISDVQGMPKTGFVTLDQTRKLLLLLESDPKAYSLPLVGIWLSGVSYLGSPVIWATCLRYMYNSSIQERVCSASDGFLVIIFSPNKRRPEFYECSNTSPSDNDGLLSFQLVGCRENLHVFKNADVTNHAPVQLELKCAKDGPNKSVFLEANKQFTPLSCHSNTTPSSHHGAHGRGIRGLGEDDDVMIPRPSPKPIMDKSPTVRPSVPELSLIFDNFGELSGSPPTPHQDDTFGPTVRRDDLPRPRQPYPQHNENSQTGPMKPGHMVHNRQMRPGPLRQIDQNSPHFQGGGTGGSSESQPRQSMGSRHVGIGGPVRSKSDSAMVVSNDRSNASVRHSRAHQPQIIPSGTSMGGVIGQEMSNANHATNKRVLHGSVDRLSGRNKNPAGMDQRRVSTPMTPPHSNNTANVIGHGVHKRQFLPNETSPHSYPRQHHLSKDASSTHQSTVTNQIRSKTPNRPSSTVQHNHSVPSSRSNDSDLRHMSHNTTNLIAEDRLSSQGNSTGSMRTSPNRTQTGSVETMPRTPPLPFKGMVNAQSLNTHHTNQGNRNGVMQRTSNHNVASVSNGVPNQHHGLPMFLDNESDTAILSPGHGIPIPNLHPQDVLSIHAREASFQHLRSQDNQSPANKGDSVSVSSPGHSIHHQQDILSIHASEASFQHQSRQNNQSSANNGDSSLQHHLSSSKEGAMSLSQRQHRQDVLSIHASQGSFQNQTGQDTLPMEAIDGSYQSPCQRGGQDTHPFNHGNEGSHPSGHGVEGSLQNHSGHQRGQDIQPSSHGIEGSLPSQDAYDQLRRQEQMIKELQAQIQMLLHAQQTAASLPPGVMTPPTTPTIANHNASSPTVANHNASSPTVANHNATTPVTQPQTTPTATHSANRNASASISHTAVQASPTTTQQLSRPASQSPTHVHAMPKSPQRSIGCSVGVNTGQSLVWPGALGNKDANSDKKLPTRKQRSPPRSHVASKDVGNSTFDLDSEPNMSLIVEGATNDTRSGISMVDMNSSLATSSKVSSPSGSPGRPGDDPSHPSDSFQSPVLGESASTCRPPGRPLVSDSEDSDECDSDGEVKGQSSAAAVPSLLYKDKNQFYANIMGNVQQLLNEEREGSGSSSSSSSEDDTDTEDSEEEQEILGMKHSPPDHLDSVLMERSAMFRSMNNTSPDFFPRINYVSIMDLTLDSPNLSLEANALAMKYLSDEELAKLSTGFKSQPVVTAATPRKDVNPLLRTALVGNLCTEKSMVGVSSVGFRAVDMSMASRKYMEKYGLLENSEGKDDGESPKKKVDKKKKKKKKTKKVKQLAASSQQVHGDQATSQPDEMSPGSDKNAGINERIRATPTLNINSQQVSPVSQTDHGTYEPWLKKPAKKLRVNTGAFQAFNNETGNKRDKVKGQSDPKAALGNILDISRLQELPKLL